MDDKDFLNLDFVRRFGVEIEINAFDMRSRAIGWQENKLPEGIHYIANLVKKITGDKVLVHKWGNDHHNNCWVVKPDGSCGIEVCTPVFKGWHGLKEVCYVVDGFRQDDKVTADSRCSLHVHVDTSDLTEAEIAAVITWWVKCEPVFMDSVPYKRKKNQYCQFIGQTDILDNIENGLLDPDILFRRLGSNKYYSMNTYHFVQRKRRTIEFRIMDNECCLNPWMTKNWVRLILHFVEQAKKRGLPPNYEPRDKWTGYHWLDPIDVFEFLGFSDRCELSAGLEQVQGWFLQRLDQHIRVADRGILGEKARAVAITQIDQMARDLRPSDEYSHEDVYGDKFRV